MRSKHYGRQSSLSKSYKTFFMLNSIEHEITTAHKNYKAIPC